VSKLESHIYVVTDKVLNSRQYSGQAISNREEFKVNGANAGGRYTIIYPISEIMELDAEEFAIAYINFIKSKMSIYNEAELFMHYIEDPDYDFQFDEIDELMARKLLFIETVIYNLTEKNIMYTVSSSMSLLSREYEEDCDDEDNYCEEDYEEVTPTHNIVKPKKVNRRSKVFIHSSNLKKNIKNHGIIITSGKKDIKKDKEILRDFLKEFIPGKSAWVKEYRSIILERWLRVYAITKKDAKKYRSDVRKKRMYYSTQQLSDQINKIRKIMDDKYDPFYDHAR
jgi:hypothetical protein